MTPAKEAFAIVEAIPNRVTPLGRATLDEAKDLERVLRGIFPDSPIYLVRLEMVTGPSDRSYR